MEPSFISYQPFTYTDQKMLSRGDDFYNMMDYRRTVREFSSKPVPISLIQQLIRTASTAPSGAHKQPWTFCIVQDPLLKKKIRVAAEEEEYENYHGRMPQEWLDDLAKLGTDCEKPFLETAPFLIIVFKKTYDLKNGNKCKNYYVQESVGIACGFLIAAIHYVGLVCLTHTPSPMNFLQEILKRPENEKPFLLIPVGFPAEQVSVPALHRKTLEEVAVFY
ncbi:MAG: nitroreductase family protein [Saprospiraceae bacterium]|nr:nitroreductase family protein [Saprospiraceae bacterium]MBK9722429.1 nitroreductase family protein [Saprospiraceae bacterium]MBK9729453.1 nitroreductase family protein [Saprospiraceae bacterium]